jgi:hypothetical protein
LQGDGHEEALMDVEKVRLLLDRARRVFRRPLTHTETILVAPGKDNR